jgi:hypothetical protein
VKADDEFDSVKK